MSDGGNAESKKEKESTVVNDREERAGSNDFGRAISRVAVAQVCESIGFESFNEFALESLADIAVMYLRDLGKTVNSYANLAGRSQCNVFDIIQGLEDMCASTGYLRASEVNNCGLNSGIVQEIVEYVESAQEIPFSQPLPRFPVVKERKTIPSFSQMGETPPFKHIPPWLPAFPDPHTYIHTPTWNERASDPRADKIELARQRRKAERSLLNLQQRLVCNDSEVASTSKRPDDVRIASTVNKLENPYLAMPFQPGEKDVAPVALRDKFSKQVYTEDHVSLVEMFSPAIEAMKDGLSETVNGMEQKLPDKRSAVCLKFRPGKKVLGDSLDLRLRKKGSGRTTLLRRDDERDDKKRRAEFILRQSMENQQELS